MSTTPQAAVSTTPPSPSIKVRCVAEIYGSVREPIAKRGDVLDMPVAEYETIKHSFVPVDGDVVAEKLDEDTAAANNERHMRERQGFHAERESSALARARTLRMAADAADRVAKDAEVKAKGGRPPKAKE